MNKIKLYWLPVFSISKVVQKELISQKLTWGFLLTGVVLLLLSLFMGEISIQEKMRVQLHIGIFGINLVAMALALTLGGFQIHREIERQTCALELVRPINRGQWCLGQWLGSVSLLVILLSGLLLLHFGLVYFSFWSQKSALSLSVHSGWELRYFLGSLVTLIEAVLFFSFAFLFSMHVRPSLSVACALVVYLACYWQSDLEFYARKTKEGYFRYAYETIKWFLPPLDQLKVRNSHFIFSADTESLNWTKGVLFLSLCFLWILVSFKLAELSFRRKDLV